VEEVGRWIGCVVVGGPAALLIVNNWLLLIGTARTRKPTSLVFPFICGPVCAAACWFGPSALRWWFWVPLAADFTLWVLVGLGIAAVVRLFARQRPPGRDPGAEPHAAADGGA
jgi:hypothetical protein